MTRYTPKHRLETPEPAGRRRLLGGTAAAVTGLAVVGAPTALAATAAPAQAAGHHHKHHHHAVSNKLVVAVARRQKGAPYGYGGDGPNRFDCSGLVQYVVAKAGRHLPRTASAQYHAVKRISGKSSRAGDLVFFRSGGDAYHVGIKTGPNRMIDAAHPGTRVSTHPIWHHDVAFGRV